MPIEDERLRSQRDTIFRRLEDLLRADPRVTAVWLGGSQSRGTDDDWSDIDVHLAVRDYHVDSLLSERCALYTRLGRVTLTQAEMISADHVYQLVMFEGPVLLDFVVHPESRAALHVDDDLNFDRTRLGRATVPRLADDVGRHLVQDRLDFFWLMMPIALKYIARERTQRAVTQYDLVSGAFIDVWRLLKDPERFDAGGVHWLHPVCDSELIEILPAFVADISVSSMFLALARLIRAMRSLHPALIEMGVDVHDDAVEDIAAFAHDIAVRLGISIDDVAP